MFPLLAFSIKSEDSILQRTMVLLISVALCYFIMNFSVHPCWDIRNGPILVKSATELPWQKTWDMQCADTGDGASLAFALLFGWIPASLYVGLCYVVMRVIRSLLKDRST